MTVQEVFDKLTPIFRRVFKDESIVITEAMSAADVARWDSLSNVIMLDEVEKEFQLKFKFKDISILQNVGELANLIIKYKSV